jgi:hypothetical protein
MTNPMRKKFVQIDIQIRHTAFYDAACLLTILILFVFLAGCRHVCTICSWDHVRVLQDCIVTVLLHLLPVRSFSEISLAVISEKLVPPPLSTNEKRKLISDYDLAALSPSSSATTTIYLLLTVVGDEFKVWSVAVTLFPS